MSNEEILELMIRRRRQILVNSCIYYEFGQSIITDQQYDKWGKELVKLNKENPDLARRGEFFDIFQDYDGTTGYHLPLDGNWIRWKANQLIKYAKKHSLLL